MRVKHSWYDSQEELPDDFTEISSGHLALVQNHV